MLLFNFIRLMYLLLNTLTRFFKRCFISRWITDEMYDKLLREYKEKQSEILSQMQDHSNADEQFYLTANATLGLAQRAKAVFNSSEPAEKRQFLAFLLQNCVLNGKKLDFTIRSPFNLLLNHNDNLTVRMG